jgi:hypothetical protein
MGHREVVCQLRSGFIQANRGRTGNISKAHRVCTRMDNHSARAPVSTDRSLSTTRCVALLTLCHTTIWPARSACCFPLRCRCCSCPHLKTRTSRRSAEVRHRPVRSRTRRSDRLGQRPHGGQFGRVVDHVLGCAPARRCRGGIHQAYLNAVGEVLKPASSVPADWRLGRAGAPGPSDT